METQLAGRGDVTAPRAHDGRSKASNPRDIILRSPSAAAETGIRRRFFDTAERAAYSRARLSRRARRRSTVPIETPRACASSRSVIRSPLTATMTGDTGTQVDEGIEWLELARVHDRQQPLDRALALLASRADHDLRHCTGVRSARSAALWVGSTASSCTKVKLLRSFSLRHAPQPSAAAG